MNRSTEVRASRVTVNDDTVKISVWHHATGAMVRRGQPLYTLETSKASFDVEAEADGYLEVVEPAGTVVPVGATIARVWEQPPVTQRVAVAAAAPKSDEPLITRRARELIAEHGISPEAFAGRGMVREADVLAIVRATSPNGATGTPAQEPVSTVRKPPPGRDPLRDARDAAAARGRSMVWLAWHYVWRTWLLTNLVRWAPRGLLIPIHRLRGVRIGRDCFIDPAATIETAHASNITIGDDVRIAAGAIIMTHIKPPRLLREQNLVESVVQPVVLEDHCFIGVNAVLMPGVRVGRGAVVASGAVVLSDVPPFTMVAGNPAKVVKRFAVQP